MKVSVLKFTLAMRDAMRAVEILNHRARRRHDAKRFKTRMREHERISAHGTHALPASSPLVKRKSDGPRISDRRRSLDELDVYRVDVAYDWALI